MLQQEGFFSYKDYYGPADIIKIKVDSDNLNLCVFTYDNVFKRGEYNFKYEELIKLINAIKKAWIDKENILLNLNKKKIELIMSKPATHLEFEENIQMSIKINNKCLLYGFDIYASRKLYMMFAQIVNNKKTTYLTSRNV